MKREILAELRKVLGKLYPDEASMRRISHDGGLDLARVSLNSNAINNWHSILIEAEKLDRIEVLLAAIRQEYGSNQEFVDVCKNIRQIDFIVPLGHWKEVRNSLFKEQSHTNAAQAIEERFQSFDWSKAEQAYLNKVIKLYDRVRILGSSSDVPLGNLFTQVYILDEPTARYRHDIEELRKRGTERDEFQRQPGKRIHGLELVETGQNLFILGKPGAGKTTFLKYITIQAAYKQLPRIPIFVSLNLWADSRWGKGDKAALLPFLIEQFDICDFPDASLFIDYLLRSGRALVLFDGLDEVKHEKDQRRRLTHLLQEFARKYDQSQHLITCRIAANDYAFAGFTDVEVADFTADQAREYALKWFGSEEKKADAFTSELAKPENEGLAELCNTPLLLSLLCLTFDNNMRFPPSRAELYEDALETLLRKWDSNRSIQRDEIYRTLSHKRKLQLLMNIAALNFQKGELFFRQRDLEKWLVDYLAKLPDAPSVDDIDSTALLKAIEAQHGILVERAQGIYSFSHLTFQEYLTARSIAENQGRGFMRQLMHSHLIQSRWREVFLLTASLLDDADEFIITLHDVVDNLIADSPRVHALLTWADERTCLAHAPVERHAPIQLAYVFLDLASTCSRTIDISSAQELVFDRALALARTQEPEISLSLARNLALDLSSTSAREIHLDRASAHPLARSIDLALVSVHSIVQATTPHVGVDYGLYYAWCYARLFSDMRLARTHRKWRVAMQQLSGLVGEIVTYAVVAGLDDLTQQLAAHIIPLPGASAQEWHQYADALFAILHDLRALGHPWSLRPEDIDKLKDYFYANELLVQCLKVATVSDRQAILNGLLLPSRRERRTEVQGRNQR